MGTWKHQVLAKVIAVFVCNDRCGCETARASYSPVPGVLSVPTGAAGFVLGMVMPT